MADMSQKSLIDDLKSSLQDAEKYFNAAASADFKRLLDVAAQDLASLRPRILRDSIDLIVDQLDYTAPADIKRVTRTDWGRAARQTRQPWNAGYINDLPTLSVVETAGGLVLELSRPMTAAELADIGPACAYFYETNHQISSVAADTTFKSADRSLLILRAQAEACQELAFRNIGKPVSIRDGVNNQPRKGSPAALAENLMAHWLRQAKRGW